MSVDSSSDRQSLTGIPRPAELAKAPAHTPPTLTSTSQPTQHSAPLQISPETSEPSTTSAPILGEQVVHIPSDVRVELENLRSEVKDLTEKLEVLKAKRAEDRGKLKEAESLKVQLAQLEENRKLMQEKSADLQRQLAQANGVRFF